MDALVGREAKSNRGFFVWDFGVLAQNAAGQDSSDFGGTGASGHRGWRGQFDALHDGSGE